MNPLINEALQLMAIGMVTVFCILLIVIFLGTVLIKLVNKFAPEEVVAKKIAPAANAVQQVDATGGKGHATKITKL